MPKRTPIEQAIAEQTDKRAVYDRRMREKGNRRVGVWVPTIVAEELRDLSAALVHCQDPSAFRDQLRQLSASVKSECAE